MYTSLQDLMRMYVFSGVTAAWLCNFLFGTCSGVTALVHTSLSLCSGVTALGDMCAKLYRGVTALMHCDTFIFYTTSVRHLVFMA